MNSSENSATRTFKENEYDVPNSLDNFRLKTIDLINEYEALDKKYDEKKSEFVREFEKISLQNDYTKELYDDLEKEKQKDIDEVMNDNSLSDDLKQRKIEDLNYKYKNKFDDYNKYASASDKERDKIMIEKMDELDLEKFKEKQKVREKIRHNIHMQVKMYVDYYQRENGKRLTETKLFEALYGLQTTEFENKEIEKFFQDTVREEIMNSEINTLYVSYSELSEHKKEMEGQFNEDFPMNDPKDPDKTKIEDEIVDSNGDSDNDDPNGTTDPEDPKDPEELEDPKLGEDPELEEDPELKEKAEEVTVISKSPKITWKTLASLAAGIGIGAAVFFTVGPTGVTVMAIAGGIAKHFVSKKRKELEAQRLAGIVPVEEVAEPQPGLKGKIEKLKQYMKTEEFYRDLTWLLNGAIYTGLGLNLANSLGLLDGLKPPVGAETLSGTETPANTPSAPNTPAEPANPFDEISIGDNVGTHNVSTGFDSANEAFLGNNAETLIPEYVNQNSIVGRLAVMGENGQPLEIISEPGATISEICAKHGIDPSKIIIDVANKSGASQAWVPAEEFAKEAIKGGLSK